MSNSKLIVPQVSRLNSQSHTDLSVCLTDSGGGTNSITPLIKRTNDNRQTQPKKQQGIRLKIATYNIRTMRLDNHLECLEQELKHIKWDIVGLCETRLPGEKTTLLKSGHILYQNNSETNSHNGGVAIMIHKNLKHQVIKMNSISSRVTYIILKLNKKYNLQVIQCYSPTSTSEDEEAEQLYEDITTARRSENARYCTIMGDFNAKIGKKVEDSINIGSFGLGNRNDRGEMLIDYLQNENLYCMNTFFKKPIQRKWTWRSPSGNVKNEIDYILTNKREICTDVSVLSKFDTGSDHRMVRATLQINTQMERNKLTRRRGCVTIEEIEKKRNKYQEILNTKLTTASLRDMEIDTLSQKITESIRTATKQICMTTRQKMSKLKPDTMKLMEKRRNMNRESDEYNQLNKVISKEIRKDLRAHNTRLIQNTIEDNKNMRVLRSKLSKGKVKICKMRNKHGIIVNSRSEIKSVVQSFYQDLYSSITAGPGNQPQVIANVGSEDMPDIDKAEIRLALRQMKNRKSPGEDQITTEMIKMGGETLEEAVIILLNKCLHQGKIPKAWHNAEVILLFKKGDIANMENYRPISLLSHLYKLLTKIITNRLTRKFDFYQPVEQAGFRKGFGTTDHLQTIHNLIEKSAEYNIPLHMAFIDYHKAFDSIETWAFLTAMDTARIDTRYSNLIKYIYENATLQVSIDEDLVTDPIPINRGVRQGDTISPKLFTLALEDVFKRLQWESRGINVDGVYLNHLRFADDIVLITSDANELERMMTELHEASLRVGLKMNLNKTKIMSRDDLHIKIENHEFDTVEEYVYLGHSIKLGKENQTSEINRRVRLSWAAYGNLGHILKNRNIPINLKRKVYDACILPVSTYGLETTTLTQKSAERLRTTQRAMERSMLGISLRDKIRNTEIRRRTKVKDIIERVAELKWRWVGHVARQDTNKWTIRVIKWRPRQTKRSIGRPQKRWLDDIKEFVGRNWHQLALDRMTWKNLEEAYVQQWTNKG